MSQERINDGLGTGYEIVVDINAANGCNILWKNPRRQSRVERLRLQEEI